VFLDCRVNPVRVGRGRGEAMRNVYSSDGQLPPGHDPGADSGEAPTIPAPAVAWLPAAGSVAHGRETFWLSAAAMTGRGANSSGTRR
jgi:hypothetical protein